MVTEGFSRSLADLTIWTIGHSTRPVEDFKQILTVHGIRSVVDVRSFPSSRRYPHFNKVELSKSLSLLNVMYDHLSALGGRRSPSPESRNTAWKNASFRAYADHMETKEFKQGIDRLLALARDKPTAIMCAEALWWRCHRSLIADYLKAMGLTVIHIIDARKTEEHPYTAAARIIEGQLSYEGLVSD